MSRRNYGQYCALSKTLDLIGERWTLLVFRELALGPKRYTDVLDGLPGINTTLLADRLRQLEADGIVGKRTLPPPAASTVYELTETGVELAWALLPLVRWGAQHALGPLADDEVWRVELPLLAMSAALDPKRIAKLTATYEFHVGGSVGHVTIDRGRVRVGAGPAESPPDVTLRADPETFVGVGVGRLSAADMIASGRMTIDGDPDALATFAAIVTDLSARAGAQQRPAILSNL